MEYSAAEDTYQNITEYSYDYIEVESHSIQSKTIFLVILTILLIFGIILNAVSILAIINSKKYENISILILNLAFADIVYLIGIPFFTMSALYSSWPFGLNGCRLFYLIDYVGMISGVYTVAALSLERYLVVTDNKKLLDKLSIKFKKIIIYVYLTFIWSIGFVFTLPLMSKIKLNTSCELNINETESIVLFWFKFSVIFLIPFCIILFSSIKLVVFLRGNQKNQTVRIKYTKRRYALESDSTILMISNQNKYRTKAIRIVLSIVLMFIIQWLPLWTSK
jgi:hypothetical protein